MKPESNKTKIMKTNQVSFHLPQKPYSLCDAINRHAAAHGSCQYAANTEYGDYNGHSLFGSWNEYRGYYVLEYSWMGRQVLCRTTNPTEFCAAAIREFKSQGRGATLNISLREQDKHIAADFNLIEGQEDHSKKSWWTPLHNQVNDAFFWKTQFCMDAVAMLANSKTVEEYEAKKKAVLDRRNGNHPIVNLPDIDTLPVS